MGEQLRYAPKQWVQHACCRRRPMSVKSCWRTLSCVGDIWHWLSCESSWMMLRPQKRSGTVLPPHSQDSGCGGLYIHLDFFVHGEVLQVHLGPWVTSGDQGLTRSSPLSSFLKPVGNKLLG